MARSYDKHFKEEALKLSDEIGAKKAADQLGILYNSSRLGDANTENSSLGTTSNNFMKNPPTGVIYDRYSNPKRRPTRYYI